MKKKTIESIDHELAILYSRMRDLKKEQAKLKSKMTQFKFKCSFELTLNEDEIWPDGDAPLNPTAKDVKRDIDLYKSHLEVMKEWCLEPEHGDHASITVTKCKTY